MTMDYSPWSERENWPFLKVAISPKMERAHTPNLVRMYLTSIPTCMNFLSSFRLIKFFDDHGLYCMVRKGKLAILKVAISPKLEMQHPPNLVCMHLTSIPTCMIFLSQFRLIKFFDDHGLYCMVRKGKLAVFESSNISETGEATPTTFGVHVLDINPYLHEFLEFIPIN